MVLRLHFDERQAKGEGRIWRDMLRLQSEESNVYFGRKRANQAAKMPFFCFLTDFGAESVHNRTYSLQILQLCDAL
ncbi:MAG: hypothetical protein R3E32_14475 [Chitinophagales bacterium]